MIGVVGGMGVQATALFYEKLIALQPVAVEQDYVDVLVYSKSSIPDRTAFITGKSKQSPLPALLHAVEILANAKVTCIAIPCVTSHFFLHDLVKSNYPPIVSMLDATATHITAAGYKKVGLLATTGTLHGRFFHNVLLNHKVNTLEPDENTQVKLMEFIYNIKKGRTPDPALLQKFSHGLRLQGAEAVILGCTELSVAAKGMCAEYIDALEILAQAALDACKNRKGRANP
jgi:aspartate racemase